MNNTVSIGDDVGKVLMYARSLDIHRWSDYVEVDEFVDLIFNKHFKGGAQRKHLKVILLDLYVVWLNDPNLKIYYSRNVNSYRPKSRYNSLHISKTTITIMDRLQELGYVGQKKGFNDRTTGKAFQTRVWPLAKLIKHFERAELNAFVITHHSDQETIILRDEERERKEYPDTAKTKSMRRLVRSYNSLLDASFIDIPTIPNSKIVYGTDSKGNEQYLFVTQTEKFTRRIFNRGSFSKGGRFYGGWWQRCPKEYRRQIYINDQPTVELDFIGLHIVLLYAREGIDYRPASDDPYIISEPEWWDREHSLRDAAKMLLLVGLNAKSEAKAFKAFRDEASAGSYEKSLTDVQLKEILSQLKKKHPIVLKHFASDAGIDLMYIDSSITECVIRECTNAGVPVLSIHDSYIVPLDQRDFLWYTLVDAYESVTGIKLSTRNVEVDAKGTGLSGREFYEALVFRKSNILADRVEKVNEKIELDRCPRYVEMYAEFCQHITTREI